VPPLIRAFREDDYDAVVRVWRAAGLTIKPSDRLPELRKIIDRNPGLFLVADDEGSVAGAVIGAWDGRRAWVYHLAVDPALQRRGIGRMLRSRRPAVHDKAALALSLSRWSRG
jgi:ribosomal protein S18 acetylase RimI-like enzyme